MKYVVIFFILIALVVGCTQRGSPPAASVQPDAQPTVPLPVQKASAAVDEFSENADGTQFATHTQVEAQREANAKLTEQYQTAIKTIAAADVKLDKRDSQITQMNWALGFQIAGGAAEAGAIVLVVILVMSGGLSSLLSFGLLEKIDGGLVLLGAILFTIAHYIGFFMYVPVIVGAIAVVVISIMLLGKHGAAFLTTVKDIIAKGQITEQHLLNPVVAAIQAKIKKV